MSQENRTTLQKQTEKRKERHSREFYFVPLETVLLPEAVIHQNGHLRKQNLKQKKKTVIKNAQILNKNITPLYTYRH